MSEQQAQRIAREQFQKAYALQMAGDIPEAIGLYQRSIEIYPTAEAHTFLGWAYSFQKKYEEAIIECHKAIQVDPDFGNPYNDIGAYLIEKGKYRDAIPWFEKAIVAKRYDSYCYPHYNLGRIYELEAKWQKALECYVASAEMNPKYSLAIKACNRLKAMFN
jgi:tetratricopeptide (TPR) repeat protein